MPCSILFSLIECFVKRRYEVLHVGDDGLGGQRSAVCQLVGGELGDIDAIEVDLAHLSIAVDAIGRGHVAYGNGV